MAQDAARPTPRSSAAGCLIAVVAGALGVLAGLALTVALWSFGGSDDAEEASISALLFIGLFTTPVCAAMSVAVAVGWLARRAEPTSTAHRTRRGDEIGLALGFGSVGAGAGVLMAIGVWARSAGGDSGGGAALLALAIGFGGFGAVLGAALALAWSHRRPSD